MAPIAIDDTCDDDAAPLLSSPRTAALYYWGGCGGREAHDGVDCNKENHHQASEKPFQKKCSGQENNMTTLWDYTAMSTFHHYSPHHHRSYSRGRHRPLIRFHLEMDDEDDCNHWMFLRPTSQQIPAPIIDNASTVATTTTKDDTVAINNNDDNNNNDEDDDFNTIPIIDLSQPSATYSTQIGNACKSTGFFYIINHGISQLLMDDVMDISRKLFDLDLESKLEFMNGDDTAATTSTDENQKKKKKKKGYRGYFGIGAEDLDNKDGTRDLANEEEKKEVTVTATPVSGDFKEGYDVGLDNDSHHAFFGRNVWPDEMKHDSIVGFRETLIRYQDELLVLADKLMVAFAMSLNSDAGSNISVPMDYFLTRTRNPMCTLRLLHYPPSLSKSNSGGCGAHTDYGLFTILFQDHIGGLQVRNHGRRWIDAKPLRGSFVINVGEMLSHWTGGLYASTVHRVISPASGSGYHRYSVPFFFNPDHDAVVEPLVNKGSFGDGRDGRDESCSNRRRSSTASEILNARYKGTFQT
jgi:isopenicillin N synthase-like dioxygenase